MLPSLDQAVPVQVPPVRVFHTPGKGDAPLDLGPNAFKPVQVPGEHILPVGSNHAAELAVHTGTEVDRLGAKGQLNPEAHTAVGLHGIGVFQGSGAALQFRE